MASIEQVKAELAQAAEQCNATTNQIRAAIEGTEQVLARLRAVAAGTGHPTISEAISRAEQSKQRPDRGGDCPPGQHPGGPAIHQHPWLTHEHRRGKGALRS